MFSLAMIPLKDDVPSQTVPVLTVGFIAANILLFLWQLSVGLQESVLRAGVVPLEIVTLSDVGPPNLVPPPLTVLSSMWLHGGWLHLAGNMLFLWIFGNNVEDSFGKVRFVIFYLLAGTVAALAQVFVNPRSEIPMIGASGAVAGVIGAYALLYPRARVLTAVPIFIFIRLMYLPAWLFIGIWFLFQILSAPYGGGVAYFAHIGGFVVGLILAKPLEIRHEPYVRQHRGGNWYN